MKKIISIIIMAFTILQANAQASKTITNATTPTSSPQVLVQALVVNTCKSNTRDFRKDVTHDSVGVATDNGENALGCARIVIKEKGDYTFFTTDASTNKTIPIVRTYLCKNPPCPVIGGFVATPNIKGEVTYKNLEPGIYTIYYQPIRTQKCPPDEVPWLGGCIPKKVLKDLSIAQNAVYCPSGKYDAPGNCIRTTNAAAKLQMQKKEN